MRGRFCRRPRPAVPAARRLISHLAAPGPVCAEPGIPPAAQPAPAPSSPPPRSSRLPAEPGRIPGAGAHNWPQLDGAPRARGAERRVWGLKLGFRCPEARRTEQCGHRRTWPARPTERRRRRRGQKTEGAAAADLLHPAARTWGIAAEVGSGAVCRWQIGVAKLGGSRGAGEAGRARAKGDNEMNRWHQSGDPRAEGQPRSVLPLQSQAAAGAAAVSGTH